MLSKFVILTSILLASGVLAVPSSSQLETRHLARPPENRWSNLINHWHIDARDAYYTINWASAVLGETPGTFTNVTGTFIVPTLKGTNGSVSIWVGIDGANSCMGSATLQTGVDFTVNSSKAWYKWSPAGETGDFHGMTIRAGNEIRTTVIASSMNSGKAVIENLTTGRKVTKELSSSRSLCGRDVDWSVQDMGDESGNLFPFPNFGTVKFTNASASGFDGKSYTLDGAFITEAKQNGHVLVSVSASNDTVTISHI